MDSRSAIRRRVPSQARGRLKVECLLAAAGAEMARQGYAGATMCGIAGRAGAAVGSLYQFYPHKEAIAEVLRERYTTAAAPLWAQLRAAAPRLPAPALAARLVQLEFEIDRTCPGFAALLDAPRTEGSARRRSQFRRRIAAVLRAWRPRLGAPRALQHAAVIQQLLRGMLSLPAASRRAGWQDFEGILARYLEDRIGDLTT
ncbi:MAG: TetR/AcrR family transcriptional regulator [Acidobacteria bacterium]|nr:MAG: TetR/AcrR family transcriptional regulator [Acidobacteriota bacterium]